MADCIEVIKGRRTVRTFQDKAVSDVMLQELLEAARWAQSWANTQCWEIVVVQDPHLRQQLQAAVSPGNPSYETLVKAPVLLAICGKKERAGYYHGKAATKFGDWMLFDLGVMTQNIALAAWALGLGSAVVGLMDHDKAAPVLQIPDACELVALMPLGYPEQETKAPPRKALESFVHQNSF